MSSVAGEALTAHLTDILPALLRCISEATDEQQVCIFHKHRYFHQHEYCGFEDISKFLC